MKRNILAIGFALAVIAAAAVPGCSRQPAGSGSGGKTRILCSTFPMYLFTRQVTAGRDNVQVDLMLASGVGCPHDYSLTPQDMQKIAGANVFVANGLGMESFLGDSLRNANDKIIVIDSSSGIGDLIMMKEDRADANAAATVPNAHLFASPRMAARVVRNIAASLAKIDPAGAKVYRRNAEAYAARLEKLSKEMVAGLKNVRSRKIVAEHEVFDYLARDCGLEVVAVIEESPGQAPTSPQEVRRLIDTIKAKHAAAVFTEPQYPSTDGETIARDASVSVAKIDPVANGPDNPPADYYETTMQANLATLIKTLGTK